MYKRDFIRHGRVCANIFILYDIKKRIKICLRNMIAKDINLDSYNDLVDVGAPQEAVGLDFKSQNIERRN